MGTRGAVAGSVATGRRATGSGATVLGATGTGSASTTGGVWMPGAGGDAPMDGTVSVIEGDPVSVAAGVGAPGESRAPSSTSPTSRSSNPTRIRRTVRRALPVGCGGVGEATGSWSVGASLSRLTDGWGGWTVLERDVIVVTMFRERSGRECGTVTRLSGHGDPSLLGQHPFITLSDSERCPGEMGSSR